MLKLYNKKLAQNNRLSCSQNLTRPTTILSVNKKIVNQSPLKQKRNLKIYVSDDDKKFIERSAAYALQLINVRAIMIGNEESYIEINDKKLEQLKNNNDIEIEFVIMEKKEVSKKQSIEVYVDNLDYYIKPSTAYALNLITVENFYAMQDQMYKVSDNLLVFLRNKYNVEEIPLEKSKSK